MKPVSPAATQATRDPSQGGLPTGSSTVTPISLEELRSQVVSAWAHRDTRPGIEQAIAALEQVSARDPSDAETATALARAYYFLADGPMRDQGESAAMLKMFEKGIAAGERALLNQSSSFQTRIKAGERVEDLMNLIPASGQASLYWYASNLGRFALAKGFTTMLFYKERVLAVMHRVLAIDESFYYGAPHRYLGAYYAKIPSFAGGDLKKSKEHFDKALQISPDFLANKVLYAELYAVRADDRPLFARLLKEVCEADVNKIVEASAEQQVEQAKAKKLLTQSDDLF